MTGDRSDELIAGFRTVSATLAAAHHASSTPPARPGPSAIPVTVLTGILGSGKTTVLRRLLSGDHGLALTAIVNDLGSVNVDAELLATTGADQLSLTNGCACCELSEDLVACLTAVRNAPSPPDAIVIEASGAADAVGIAATVEGLDWLRLDGVVGVVDADAWPEQRAHHLLGPLVERQLAAAHLILLSKVDLIEPSSVEGLVAALAAATPGRRVIPVSDGAVDPALLLGAADLGATLPLEARPHRLEVATGTISLPGPLDLARLAEWLERDAHGLLRAKGLLRGDDGLDHELQVVGRRWTLTRTDPASPTTDHAVVLLAPGREQVDAAEASIEAMVGAPQNR